MPNPDFIPVNIALTMAIRAHGAPLTANLFTVGILDDEETLLHTATNAESGLVTFQAVSFSDIGTYNYTTKIVSLSADWTIDNREWPIKIEVINSNDILHATVTYPNGVPTFENTHSAAVCKGPFEFPELTFNAAGTYEFSVDEITPSGDGWVTDDKVVTVIVNVVDDGHGHLVATVTYPGELPTFTNTYHSNPVCVVIKGCKLAVGAPLPTGKFLFGLYDDEGKLISSVTNDSLEDTEEDA